MADRARDFAALSAAARLAADEYERLARERRERGLNEAVIRANAAELTEDRGGRWTVTERAYLPTAVALGVPLDAETTAHLRATLALIEERFAAAAKTSEPVLAHVPPEAYHITVANRAHYEHTAPQFLSADEFEVVRDCVTRLHLGAIEVTVDGFMITAHGKLFFKCMPIDDRLLELRTRLVEALPALSVNLPKTAHMKLAHLRVPVPLDAIDAIEQIAGTQRTIAFTDVYTPCGRIPLRQAA